MKALKAVIGIAIPYNHPSVDTDQLMPARYLMKPRAYDYGKLLFHDLRFGAHAVPNFPLDDPAYKGARIIVTGPNFGCGSAREQAVYGLKDFGILALVGPSFGDIFRTNCVKNGILAAQLDLDLTQRLAATLRSSPGAHLNLDLVQKKITREDGTTFSFEVRDADRDYLLMGKDDITRTLEHEHAILEFERNYFVKNRWNPASNASADGRKI
jgi:3-isopropylmalate/(R)-2-methylmalate dehydratase small subunit